VANAARAPHVKTRSNRKDALGIGAERVVRPGRAKDMKPRRGHAHEPQCGTETRWADGSLGGDGDAPDPQSLEALFSGRVVKAK